MAANVALGTVAFGGLTTGIGKTLQKGVEIGQTFKDVAGGFASSRASSAKAAAL